MMAGDNLITLIVPAYNAAGWISKCLKSIRAQTLDRRLFEVVVVVNGPVDATPHIVETILGDDASLEYRILYAETASLSHARNLGITIARGRWVTWVDVDDWISPNFLLELAESARDGVVPIAQLVDVDEESREESVSPITAQMLDQPAGIADPANLWRSLGFAACKLIPVELARQTSFDVNLRSGEDVAYFAPFFAKHGLQFDTRPAHNSATYYRMVRAGSMSRQEPNFDFSVTERIEVMRHLSTAMISAPVSIARVMRRLINSQSLFISRFLDRVPTAYPRVRDALVAAGLNHTPWEFVTSRTPNLAISYNFPPYVDASAMVAAKRIYNSGAHWNVISNSMSDIRSRDAGLLAITGPAVSRHKSVNAPPAFRSWAAVESFCALGTDAIAELVAESGPQTNLYSRSMWPASHFLAALHKARNGDGVQWTAEFSDPLSRDATGAPRVSDSGGERLRSELAPAIRAAGFSVPESSSLFEWAEYLPYVLADTLLFTNSHQLSYMLSYLNEPRLVQLVRRKARIAPQPVLPQKFYELREPRYELDPTLINIGYFGTFYENRSANDIVRALSKSPAKVRRRVVLHIFAPANESMSTQIQELKLTRVVKWRNPVAYLNFLALSRQFDVLLIADADTVSAGRRLNPYRPSKLSDYVGAGAPIWALYEPGSILSREDVAYRTRIGDIDGIVSALSEMVEGVTQ